MAVPNNQNPDEENMPGIVLNPVGQNPRPRNQLLNEVNEDNEIPNWRSHFRSFEDKMEYMLKTGLMSNITLMVSNNRCSKEYKAHAEILCINSQYFENIINANGQRSITNLEIRDADPDAFWLILKFMYTDSIEIKSMEEAAELFKLSERFLLYNLREKCINFMSSGEEEEFHNPLRSV